MNQGKSYISIEKECLGFIYKETYINHMQIMLMNDNEVDSKILISHHSKRNQIHWVR